MEHNRMAVVGIFVHNPASVERINELLHEYAPYIVGRLGVPCRDKGVAVISIILDAPGDIVGALSGKLGMLADVQAKAIYAKQ